MPLHARTPLALGIAFLVAGIACGGGDSSGPPPSGRKTVLVANNEFQPATVTISAGDTIIWSWSSGSAGHNIISDVAPTFPSLGTTASPGVLGTDYFNAPKSHQVIFNNAGTYAYYCSQHNLTMTGQVVVNP
jgi:plastocyanin